MFRPEMQKAIYPQFFEVPRTAQPDADAAELIRRFETAYPGYRLVGIDWPTYGRETVLAYVSKGNEFLTVFAHPQTATILGELPEQSWLRWLQELHFHLLAGAWGSP